MSATALILWQVRALNALRQLDADTAHAVAQRVLLTDPRGALQEAAWTALVTKGDPGDIYAFEMKATPTVYGNRQDFSGC